jgi:hypothetical protein
MSRDAKDFEDKVNALVFLTTKCYCLRYTLWHRAIPSYSSGNTRLTPSELYPRQRDDSEDKK